MHASGRALIILLSPRTQLATQHIAPVSAFARAGCRPLVFSFAQQRAHHPVYFLPLDLQVQTLQRVFTASTAPSFGLPALARSARPLPRFVALAPAAVIFCPSSLQRTLACNAR
ncbi:hypothetical protein OH76DRAFT_1491175 [Lentinus brumalis]|uniref:Uncharacterized protein n=1 Tax=Lentinus brumalis TaxID=2498619 RepID=A0A371CGL2_9APHY|nr:hypothetical protein OH76DRAFT_1491175 [Polyporus brumalis]